MMHGRAQGIPEPPVVLYGNVTRSGVQVTSGTLTLRVTRTVSGSSADFFTKSVQLQDLGEFSYVVQVPCETSLSTSPPTNAGAMFLSSTSNTYHFEALIDGSPASFLVPANSNFVAAPFQRGRLILADLAINALCNDLNTNGICDPWEYLHFGQLVTADADPDDDGSNNLFEFLAGTDPRDSQSVFVILSYSAAANGGFLLNWASSSNRTYTILSAAELSQTNNFSVVRSNIPATPPLNSFLDTNTVPRFYRIKLDL